MSPLHLRVEDTPQESFGPQEAGLIANQAVHAQTDAIAKYPIHSALAVVTCALRCRGNGFDLELVRAVSDAVTIPVIASSGAGCPEHFKEVFDNTGAAAALAAGIFHRKEVSIEEVKAHMSKSGIPTRTS